MFRIKRKFAWRLTSATIIYSTTSIGGIEIHMRFYFVVQQLWQGRWIDRSTNYLTYEDAYPALVHFIKEQK